MIVKARQTVLWVLGCQCLAVLPALAQNTLTLPMEVVWIKNPSLSVESPGSVMLYRINPQYTLQRTQTHSRTALSLGALVEQSSVNSLSADRTLPSLALSWQSLDPVSSVGVRASLEDASTRETEFAEFGRVIRDGIQRTSTLGTTWTRQLSERALLETGFSHARVSYNTSTLTPYRETRGFVAYGFEYSPNTRYTLAANASHLRAAGTASSTLLHGIRLRYESELSEKLTLNTSLGATRTNEKKGTTAVGSLNLAFRGERIGYSLMWSRDISAARSLSGYSRSETVDASAALSLTDKTRVSVGVIYARTLNETRDAGETVYARLYSELSPFWVWGAGVEHRRAMRAALTDAKGALVSVGLTYTHPDF